MTAEAAPQRLPFYDYNKLYSYNAVLNFVVGGRGIGKTFGAKKRVIVNAIKSGEQFIYLRRYREELSSSRQTFFADIEPEFPNHIFRVNGGEAQMATPVEPYENEKGKLVTPKPEWVTIGFFVSLASAQGKKSVSYHRVRTIIFDEFIIEKGLIHYLPDEATALVRFLDTVDRYRDNVRVLLLANSTSMSNPYFDEYGVNPDQVGEWSTYFPSEFGPFMVVHFPDSAAFKAEVIKTRFGRFIKDSEYAKSSMDNIFPDANSSFVAKKTSAAIHRYNLETEKGTFSVWKDQSRNIYFVIRRVPDNGILYTTVRDRMDVGKTYLEPNSKLLQFLRSAFNNSKVYFDEPRTRNALAHITRRQ